MYYNLHLLSTFFGFCFLLNMSLEIMIYLLHCMGLSGISVHFVVDLYRGDRFVVVTNHTVKMCIYSSSYYVLDFNLSITVAS